MPKKEILINNFNEDELRGMFDVATGNLYRRMVNADAETKIKITDLITDMRRNLITIIKQKNN